MSYPTLTVSRNPSGNVILSWEDDLVGEVYWKSNKPSNQDYASLGVVMGREFPLSKLNPSLIYSVYIRTVVDGVPSESNVVEFFITCSRRGAGAGDQGIIILSPGSVVLSAADFAALTNASELTWVVSGGYGGAVALRVYEGYSPGYPDVLDNPTRLKATLSVDAVAYTYHSPVSGGPDHNFRIDYIDGDNRVIMSSNIAHATNRGQ